MDFETCSKSKNKNLFLKCLNVERQKKKSVFIKICVTEKQNLDGIGRTETIRMTFLKMSLRMLCMWYNV